MDSQLFDTLGKLVSCILSSVMVFRYFDEKYIRVYRSGRLYTGVITACCIVNFGISLINNPALNMSFWLSVVTLTGKFLYYEEKINRKKIYFINIAFIFAYSICESIGVILANTFSILIKNNQDKIILSFINAVSGSVTAIFLYYLVLQKIFIREKVQKITIRQYSIYSIITVCTLLNIGQILFMTRYELGYRECIFVILDSAFIIFINLYLLNALEALAENNELRYKIGLYERQAKSNYEYYMRQLESRRAVLSSIHDIEKHIKVMHDLKSANEQDGVREYMDAFENMAAPLLFSQYSDNAVLNVIINDKANYCRQNGIQFDVEIQNVQMEFMKPVDITTVFGNILDNAVLACEKAETKKVELKIFPFNGFVFVQLSNTFSGEIFWNKRGRPISQKGDKHGIGLDNVEKVLKEYCGEIQFKIEQDLFKLEIMFNQP